MSNFFGLMEDYIPSLILGPLWLVLFPFRFLALLMLPPNSRRSWHKLHPVYEFFVFEKL